MCRSSQYNHSIVEYDESKRNSREAMTLQSTRDGKENDIISTLDRAKREPTKNLYGQPSLQEVKVNDSSSKEESSPQSLAKKVLSPRKNFYQFNAQDISIALATFPEFFSQGMGVVNEETLVQQGKQEPITEDLSVRKQDLQSECRGLVLWYIREYGL